MATMPATAARDDTGDRRNGPGRQSTTAAGGRRGASGDRQAPLGFGAIALVFGLPLFVVLAGVLNATPPILPTLSSIGERSFTLNIAQPEGDPVEIEVRYRDATLTGIVDPGRTDLDAIEAAATSGLTSNIDSTGLVEAEPATEPADQEQAEVATGPVRISVVYDGMTLRVGGTVLNEGQHNVVLETLDLLTGRAEIVEQLAISRLAPAVEGADARIADLVTAVESMNLVDEWSILLTDRILTIEAVVDDPEVAAAVGALDGLLTSTPTTIELTGLPAVEEA